METAAPLFPADPSAAPLPPLAAAPRLLQAQRLFAPHATEEVFLMDLPTAVVTAPEWLLARERTGAPAPWTPAADLLVRMHVARRHAHYWFRAPDYARVGDMERAGAQGAALARAVVENAEAARGREALPLLPETFTQEGLVRAVEEAERRWRAAAATAAETPPFAPKDAPAAAPAAARRRFVVDLAIADAVRVDDITACGDEPDPAARLTAYYRSLLLFLHKALWLDRLAAAAAPPPPRARAAVAALSLAAAQRDEAGRALLRRFGVPDALCGGPAHPPAARALAEFLAAQQRLNAVFEQEQRRFKTKVLVAQALADRGEDPAFIRDVWTGRYRAGGGGGDGGVPAAAAADDGGGKRPRARARGEWAGET